MSMPMSAKQVLKEALDLPEEERAELVRDLLDSFGNPPQTERTDEEWLAEIERRADLGVAAGNGATGLVTR